MDDISQFAGMHFAKYGRKMKNCKKLKKVLQRGSLMTRCDSSAQLLGENYIRKMRGCKHFKEMDFAVLMPPGWYD